MAKKGALGSIGILLSLIAGILVFIGGLILIVAYLVTDVRDAVQNLQFDVLALGNNAFLVYGLLSLVVGGLVIWAWKNDKIERNMLIWGVVFIVLGLITSNLVSLLLIVGGLLLVIDYFL